ncbi:MAG: CpaD family pilus assembly protein [Hyphomonadaceae bacterium]
MKMRLLSTVAGLAALSGLAACATTAPPEVMNHRGPTLADNHQISVLEGTERMEIPVAPGDMALSFQAQGDLQRFAALYSRQGHGPIVISTPQGSENSDEAARIAQQARMTLSQSGVPYGAIAGAIHESQPGENAPVIVSFMLYEAHAPECAPIWSQDLAHPAGNTATYESFGCSAAANLAAMIEDPRDLLRPRDETPRDAARRAVVLGHYREGEVTASDRSEDERVRVSDAVN